MMHAQIEDEEIIERYARNQLAPEERRAFEEHFFSCEECFEKLQATERFMAGMRNAVERGLLSSGSPQAALARGWRSWMLPALALSTCAALAFAAVTGWVFLFQLPSLRQQLQQVVAELRVQQETQAALEKQFGRGAAEANLPFVMLEATRDLQAPPSEVTLPAGAQRVVLWAEVGPAGRFRSFRLQVYAADNKLIETLEHLNRNSYGALVGSLPADRLPAGDYLIKLSGQEPPPSSVVAEYRLRIRRP